MLRSLKGASAAISFSSMAMSPDGTEIVSGDGDGSIRIWDVAEGKQLQEVEAHIKKSAPLPFRLTAKRLHPPGATRRSSSGIWEASKLLAAEPVACARRRE
jgi:WD40 repeat protein